MAGARVARRQLLDARPRSRDALIDALSAGDAKRRAELQALRAECEREPALLSRPPADRFAALLESEERFPDALRERYRLTGELGRGGMATVSSWRGTSGTRATSP